MNYFKKRDFILAAVLLAIALAAFFYIRFSHRTPAMEARVYVDGNLTETLNLNQNQELNISGADGGSNHLIIKDGEIWCSDATCPDKLCVKQGKKHLNTDTIICRPNRVSVVIVGLEP